MAVKCDAQCAAYEQRRGGSRCLRDLSRSFALRPSAAHAIGCSDWADEKHVTQRQQTDDVLIKQPCSVCPPQSALVSGRKAAMPIALPQHFVADLYDTDLYDRVVTDRVLGEFDLIQHELKPLRRLPLWERLVIGHVDVEPVFLPI